MDIVAKFWGKVDKGEGCWTWTAGRNIDGYGKFWAEGKDIPAHRFIWQLNNGPIPGGLQVLHKCDNPSCVNPDHLFLGTNADNVRDRVLKGRSKRGGSRGGGPGSIPPYVHEIRKRYAAGGILQRTLAKEYGLCLQEISRIVRGAVWKCPVLVKVLDV